MNQAPASTVEIQLNPGEFFFGSRDTRINTILGSCVAITLWHPGLLIGGMCHYMLPGTRKVCHPGKPDGRYADDAMLMFLEELAKTGTRPKDYIVKMFGGGKQFPGGSQYDPMCVPDSNVEAGRQLLALHGFTLSGEDMGGNGHRRVIFDIWTGDVWMKFFSK